MLKNASPPPSIKVEPEIQFDALSLENLADIKSWLIEAGGYVTKENRVEDSPYFDTKNNRLIREGIECRLKRKKGIWRTDLKTSVKTTDRVVLPDEYGVVWRNELCSFTTGEQPFMEEFAAMEALKPVQNRVSRIFEKQLIEKFRARLSKTKIERKISGGVIEYSLQHGHMITPDGTRQSDPLHILEIELRDGDDDALYTAISEFRNAFPTLNLLEKRKVMIGFELITPDMTLKAQRKFEKLQSRIQSHATCDLAAA